MTNLNGQSLGRYHILEQLGEGGMATVYKAYDTRLESDVAVKVIRTENLAPSILNRSLKRFEREAKSLAKLTHANIVNVLDYGEHEGKPYLVMPYLPGGTLKAKLNGRPVPWQEAARILLPIARALGYAHEQGMIHRDVKPANILITHSGDPMLTDFGIAKIIDEEATQDLTGTSAAVGTPEYMAPEQVTAKSVDHRADIYALGVVFYEMVTGRKPFQADTPMAVLFKHASEPLPRPTQFAPELPDAVEKILLKALAKKAENRYASMGELAVALEKLAQGFPGTGAIAATQAEKVSEGKLRTGQANEPDSKINKSWWLSRPFMIVAVIGLIILGLTFAVINWPGETGLSPSLLALETPIPSPALLPGTTQTHEQDGIMMQDNQNVETISPTLFPTETNVDSPILTSTPTLTTPTPFIENSVIKFSDDFLGTSFGFKPYGNVQHLDGNIRISKGGGITYRTSISEGTSVIYLLNFSLGEFDCYLANKPSYWNRYVGIKTNTGYDLITSVASGNQYIGGETLDGNLVFSPNQQYLLMIKWLNGSTFYIRVWEYGNTDNYSEKGLRLGSDFEEQTWYPHCNVTRGELLIDAFQELEE